jgi:N utilization substance protein A
LASKLTEWRIDVKSESKYQKSLKEGYDSLLALPGVGDATADTLYEAGFASAEELAGGLVEELVVIPGISQQKAAKFIDAAKEYVAEQEETQAEQEEAQAEKKEVQADEQEKSEPEEGDAA